MKPYKLEVIPQYKLPDDLDQEIYKYKAKPYQCSLCEHIFANLDAYLQHGKAGLHYEQCPSTKQLQQLGLYQTPNGHWHRLASVELDETQTEILQELEAQSFRFSDFKDFAYIQAHPYKPHPTFEEMAGSTEYEILDSQQIRQYQADLKAHRLTQPEKKGSQKDPKYLPNYKTNWREQLEELVVPKPFWMTSTPNQITNILNKRLQVSTSPSFDDVALTASEWNNLNQLKDTL